MSPPTTATTHLSNGEDVYVSLERLALLTPALKMFFFGPEILYHHRDSFTTKKQMLELYLSRRALECTSVPENLFPEKHTGVLNMSLKIHIYEIKTSGFSVTLYFVR